VRTARELFDMMNGARGQAFQRLSEQFGFPGSASGPGQYPEQGQPPGPAQSASEGWSAAGGQSASAGGAPGQGQAPGYGQFPVQDYFGQSASQGRPAAPGQQPPGPGQPAGAGGYAGQEQPPVQQQFPGQGQQQFPGPGLAPNQGQSGGGSQPPGQGQFPWRRRRNSDDDFVEGPDPRRRGNRSGRDSDFFSGDNIVDDIGGAVMGAALGFAGRSIGRRMMKAFEDKVVPAVQARAGLAQQQFQQQKAEQDAIVARYPELRGCTKDQVIFLDGGMRTVPVSELRMPVTLAQADQVVARLR
jgi:hypothetical protein